MFALSSVYADQQLRRNRAITRRRADTQRPSTNAYDQHRSLPNADIVRAMQMPSQQARPPSAAVASAVARVRRPLDPEVIAQLQQVSDSDESDFTMSSCSEWTDHESVSTCFTGESETDSQIDPLRDHFDLMLSENPSTPEADTALWELISSLRESYRQTVAQRGEDNAHK